MRNKLIFVLISFKGFVQMGWTWEIFFLWPK